jgi:hypothetical protein
LAIPKNRSPAVLALGLANHRQSTEALTDGDIYQIVFADCFPEATARSGAGVHAQGIAGHDFFIATVANA